MSQSLQNTKQYALNIECVMCHTPKNTTQQNQIMRRRSRGNPNLFQKRTRNQRGTFYAERPAIKNMDFENAFDKVQYVKLMN